MVEISGARLGSFLLGGFYSVNGAIKLFRVEPFTKLHDDQLMRFRRWAPKFPTAPDWYPPPRHYMTCVGVCEGVAGLMLLFGPRKYRRYSCVALMVMMGGAVYTLSQSGFQEDRYFIPVPLFCLFCLFWNYTAITSSRDR